MEEGLPGLDVEATRNFKILDELGSEGRSLGVGVVEGLPTHLLVSTIPSPSTVLSTYFTGTHKHTLPAPCFIASLLSGAVALALELHAWAWLTLLTS
jgi:hypothetical protein